MASGDGPISFEGMLIFGAAIFLLAAVVSLLVKDGLANVGARIMLLFQQPFKVGDTIQIEAATGRVSAIGLLRTRLTTQEGATVSIPNTDLAQATISNVGTLAPRAADLIYGIEANQDIESTIDIIEEVLSSDKRILSKSVKLLPAAEWNSGTIFVTARIRVPAMDYWSVVISTNMQVKRQFSAEEILVTYP